MRRMFLDKWTPQRLQFPVTKEAHLLHFMPDRGLLCNILISTRSQDEDLCQAMRARSSLGLVKPKTSSPSGSRFANP
jgi:hypothetical protein